MTKCLRNKRRWGKVNQSRKVNRMQWHKATWAGRDLGRPAQAPGFTESIEEQPPHPAPVLGFQRGAGRAHFQEEQGCEDPEKTVGEAGDKAGTVAEGGETLPVEMEPLCIEELGRRSWGRGCPHGGHSLTSRTASRPGLQWGFPPSHPSEHRAWGSTSGSITRCASGWSEDQASGVLSPGDAWIREEKVFGLGLGTMFGVGESCGI